MPMVEAESPVDAVTREKRGVEPATDSLFEIGLDDGKLDDGKAVREVLDDLGTLASEVAERDRDDAASRPARRGGLPVEHLLAGLGIGRKLVEARDPPLLPESERQPADVGRVEVVVEASEHEVEGGRPVVRADDVDVVDHLAVGKRLNVLDEAAPPVDEGDGGALLERTGRRVDDVGFRLDQPRMLLDDRRPDRLRRGNHDGRKRRRRKWLARQSRLVEDGQRDLAVGTDGTGDGHDSPEGERQVLGHVGQRSARASYELGRDVLRRGWRWRIVLRELARLERRGGDLVQMRISHGSEVGRELPAALQLLDGRRESLRSKSDIIVRKQDDKLEISRIETHKIAAITSTDCLKNSELILFFLRLVKLSLKQPDATLGQTITSSLQHTSINGAIHDMSFVCLCGRKQFSVGYLSTRVTIREKPHVKQKKACRRKVTTLKNSIYGGTTTGRGASVGPFKNTS